MNLQDLFNENVSRVNKGKKRSIGGALSLNKSSTGKIFYLKQSSIIRFYLNAQYENEIINHEVTYSSINMVDDKTAETVKSGTIFFALTYGDDEKAGVSTNYKDKYFYFSPKSSGFFLLYFDALMQKSSSDDASIVSFIVLVDNKMSDTEVYFGSTDNKSVSSTLYALASNYRRG